MSRSPSTSSTSSTLSSSSGLTPFFACCGVFPRLLPASLLAKLSPHHYRQLYYHNQRIEGGEDLDKARKFFDSRQHLLSPDVRWFLDFELTRLEDELESFENASTTELEYDEWRRALLRAKAFRAKAKDVLVKTKTELNEAYRHRVHEYCDRHMTRAHRTGGSFASSATLVNPVLSPTRANTFMNALSTRTEHSSPSRTPREAVTPTTARTETSPVTRTRTSPSPENALQLQLGPRQSPIGSTHGSPMVRTSPQHTDVSPLVLGPPLPTLSPAAARTSPTPRHSPAQPLVTPTSTTAVNTPDDPEPTWSARAVRRSNLRVRYADRPVYWPPSPTESRGSRRSRRSDH
ncbi:hypothetical protein C8Q77DRAFT_800052 [Trametes polyzona]|nr:hypothetical protein C8Q77DRAFT_800052 [Trametes polyzona]